MKKKGKYYIYGNHTLTLSLAQLKEIKVIKKVLFTIANIKNMR